MISRKLKEEWRKSVPYFLQCSPRIHLADLGTPKESQFPKAGIWHGLMLRCLNYTDFWCTTHLGALPRPLSAVEMALASEQANTPSSASFPVVHHHWDRLEEGCVEMIMTKALPIPHPLLYHENYHESRQLPLGCSGQEHVWGAFTAVPDVQGMLQCICNLQEWEFTFEEKVPLFKTDSSFDAHDYELVESSWLQHSRSGSFQSIHSC